MNSKLDSILCNGDLSEPESDYEECFGTFSITKNKLYYYLKSCYIESGAQVGEKSLFKLTPDFKRRVDIEADCDDDGVLYKFGSIEKDWEKEALKLAWLKCDLRDDEY